jgi:hypothetical protein
LYIIGYGFKKDDEFNVILIFNDDGNSEREMLEAFGEIMNNYDYLISYNGDTFDIPYMKSKLSKQNLATDFHGLTKTEHDRNIIADFDRIISIDLYKITRKWKKFLGLDSAKQIDIENLVNFKRQSFISGGKLIDAYKDYLDFGSESLLFDMLTHNKDDICGLISITEFVNLPYVIDELVINDIKNLDDSIIYTCAIPKLPCRITYSDDYMYFNATGNEMKIHIKKLDTTMNYYFKDYRNYYYLPLEKMAVHKSVAEYIDKAHKEKATKETAKVSKTSSFIIAPKHYDEDLFHITDLKSTAYVEVQDKLLTVCDLSYDYIRKALHDVLPR